MGIFSIVPLIAYSVKIPVMAARGITDRRTFKASFALGAERAFCRTLSFRPQKPELHKTQRK